MHNQSILIMALRDDVWDSVLHVLKEEGRLQISDLPFEDSQRHTVRRTLREMENKGWLMRESERGKIWYAGPVAKESLNMDSRAEVLSDPDFEL